MSSSQSFNKQQKKQNTNKQIASSIVHKPFATGTVNIFNPYRRKAKTEQNQSDLSDLSKPTELANLSATPKLFLNAELEESEPASQSALSLELAELESGSTEYEYEERQPKWFDSLLSPWGISAIAILFFVNLLATGVVWRNAIAKNTEAETPVSTVGSANLSNQEFVPLNLSTLSLVKPNENISATEPEAEIVPISPALAPLTDITNLSSVNTPYFYILAEYQGDKSLSLARQQVGQVSLVNLPQGAFIYLGALRDREQAEKFVAQLQQSALPAQIYPFD